MGGSNLTPPTHLAIDTYQGVEVHRCSPFLDPPQHGWPQVLQTGVVGGVSGKVFGVPGTRVVNDEYKVQHLSLRGVRDAV